MTGDEVTKLVADHILLGVLTEMVEVFVDDAGAFGGFDEYEAYGYPVDIGIAQAVPVDVVLVVADIDASDGACRVADVSEAGFDVEGVVDDDARDEVDEYGGNDGQKCPQGVARRTADGGRGLWLLLILGCWLAFGCRLACGWLLLGGGCGHGGYYFLRGINLATRTSR